MNNSENDKTTVPSADAVLEALRFEIEYLASEQTRPGWTIWALLGSLAAVVYMFLDQLAGHEIWIESVAKLSVVLMFTVDFAIIVKDGLTPDSRGKRTKPGRLRISSEHFRKERIVYVTTILRMLGAAAIIRIYSGYTPTISRWSAYSYCLLAVVATVHQAKDSFREIRVAPTPKSSSVTADVIVFLMVGVPLLLGALGICRGLIQADMLNVASCRYAALLVAAIYIVETLADGVVEVPELGELREVHRSLALGKIDVATAVRRADSALAGLDAGDAFRSEIDALERTVAAISTSATEAKSTLMALWATNGEQLGASEQHRVVFDAVAGQCKSELKRLRQMHNAATQEFDKLRKTAYAFHDGPPEGFDVMEGQLHKSLVSAAKSIESLMVEVGRMDSIRTTRLPSNPTDKQLSSAMKS